ncbi:hypothetical protein KSP40_PGU005538 [Platanthera guangdongensis]|uniref:Maturase K n=1 Tax=Platanthera guangdongensis TaxID=2320717 RepID=A0ABR2M528_9ASPA
MGSRFCPLPNWREDSIFLFTRLSEFLKKVSRSSPPFSALVKNGVLHQISEKFHSRRQGLPISPSARSARRFHLLFQEIVRISEGAKQQTATSSLQPPSGPVHLKLPARTTLFCFSIKAIGRVLWISFLVRFKEKQSADLLKSSSMPWLKFLADHHYLLVEENIPESEDALEIDPHLIPLQTEGVKLNQGKCFVYGLVFKEYLHYSGRKLGRL